MASNAALGQHLTARPPDGAVVLLEPWDDFFFTAWRAPAVAPIWTTGELQVGSSWVGLPTRGSMGRSPNPGSTKPIYQGLQTPKISRRITGPLFGALSHILGCPRPDRAGAAPVGRGAKKIKEVVDQGAIGRRPGAAAEAGHCWPRVALGEGAVMAPPGALRNERDVSRVTFAQQSPTTAPSF